MVLEASCRLSALRKQMNTELVSILNKAVPDVKSLANVVPSLESSRPSHCHRCKAAAGYPGAFEIYGHGLRERDAWGPAKPAGAAAEVLTVIVRRFRCRPCGHVMTIRPPFLARYFRYTTAAIALALWLWTMLRKPERAVRGEISPWPVRGACDAERFRSLHRWAGRANDIFGLPDNLVGETQREVTVRVVALLTARAPPELSPRLRVFAGAQL
jgi:hypothetical protein